MKVEDLERGEIAVISTWRNTLLSRLIRLFVGSKVSHNGIVFKVKEKVIVIDAQKMGVFMWNFDLWQRRFNYDYEINRIPQSDEIAKILSDFYFENAGKKYPKIELLVQAWFKISGRWIRTKNQKDLMVCSELTMKFLKEIEICDWSDERIMKSTPKDCYEFVKSLKLG